MDVPGPQIEEDDLPVPQVMKENPEEFKVPQEGVTNSQSLLVKLSLLVPEHVPRQPLQLLI